MHWHGLPCTLCAHLTEEDPTFSKGEHPGLPSRSTGLSEMTTQQFTLSLARRATGSVKPFTSLGY